MTAHRSEIPGVMDNIPLDLVSDFVLFFTIKICVYFRFYK